MVPCEGSIGFGYEERDKGFNGPGRYTQTTKRIIDAHVKLKPTENISLLARFDQCENGRRREQARGFR